MPVDEIREVEIKKISFNPYQPRSDFTVIDLKELAQSIQEIGIVQPPVVREVSKDGSYELISGERRMRAAEIAGMHSIPVLVRHSSNAQSAQAALIENIQRVDLNPIEIARSLRRLMDEFEYNQDELAYKVAKKRSTVANYLRLLTLSEEIQDSLYQGDMSMGHAKVLLSIDNEYERDALFRRILKHGLSVRDAEKGANKKVSKEHQEKDCHLIDLETRLQERLGTKVEIHHSGKKGRIYIDYYSLDDLDRVLEIIQK